MKKSITKKMCYLALSFLCFSPQLKADNLKVDYTDFLKNPSFEFWEDGVTVLDVTAADPRIVSSALRGTPPGWSDTGVNKPASGNLSYGVNRNAVNKDGYNAAWCAANPFPEPYALYQEVANLPAGEYVVSCVMWVSSARLTNQRFFVQTNLGPNITHNIVQYFGSEANYDQNLTAGETNTFANWEMTAGVGDADARLMPMSIVVNVSEGEVLVLGVRSGNWKKDGTHSTSQDGFFKVDNFRIERVVDEDPNDFTYKINNPSFELMFEDDVLMSNPVISGSYADPTVIRVGKEFYVYVTSARVRGYKSTDLIHWDRIGSKSEVFTTKPDFTGDADAGMWAPDINYFDGKYVMYYSMSIWGGGATCGIGIGVSSLPQGPFVSPAGNPNGKLFVSGEIGVHNSIDPCFFEENGKRYLFWGSFNGLYMTELTDDGMAVKDLSKKTKVAGKSFEATYIHKRGQYYYLFASIGGCCDGMTSSYKVVVGRSLNLEGPYLSKNGKDMKTFDAWNPTNYQPIVLKANTMFGGPGHNSRILTDDNGVDWMLYHAYFNNGSSRELVLDKVNWDDSGWPLIGNGTPSHTLTTVPVFK